MRSLNMALFLVVIAAFGCGKHADGVLAGGVVFPGRGIPDVVALGMPLDEIRLLPDASFDPQPSARYWCEIPSLGVSFSGFETDFRLSERIRFEVASRPDGSRFGFRGRLSCGLSFAEGQDVNRDDVVAFFGAPSDSIDGTGEVQSKAAQLMDDATPFSVVRSLKNGSAYEAVHYPAAGIMFLLIDDRVTMFEVFSARAIGATGVSDPQSTEP